MFWLIIQFVIYDDTADLAKEVNSPTHQVATEGSNLRLRSDQSANSDIIGSLENGSLVRVLKTGEEAVVGGKKGNWMQIKTADGTIGWCFSAFLQTVDSKANKVSAVQHGHTKDSYIQEAKRNNISYDRLARDTEALKGKVVSCRGQIIQILEGRGRSIEMRVDITNMGYGLWGDTIYVSYTYEPNQTRFLEGDIINIFGTVRGRKSYQSVLGAKITLPAIDAKYVQR